MTTMTPCREWQNTNGEGYARVKVDGKWKQGSRHLIERVEGRSLAPDEHVMHLCDNPACIRYDHLRVGTRSDNMLDMEAKGRGRSAWTHCIHGHEFTEENTGRQTINGRAYRYCRECKRARGRAQYALMTGKKW